MKKRMIHFASALTCLSLAAACVPEPLTGQDGNDMSAMADTGGTPDTGSTPVQDMGNTPAPDTGTPPQDQGSEPDMPAGPTNPFMTSDTAAVMAGETEFTTTCGGCHNAEGTGVAKVALTATAGKEDAYIFTSIRDGIPTKGMPNYGPESSIKKLDDNQIWQIVTYIKATYGQ